MVRVQKHENLMGILLEIETAERYSDKLCSEKREKNDAKLFVVRFCCFL